jgi:uncharacterized protein
MTGGTKIIGSAEAAVEKLVVAETGTSLGRGVFAGRRFGSGEVVEVAPVVLIDLKTQPFPGTIRRLVYNWSKTQVALALGYGSLYNHHDQPNLTFKRNTTNQTITFSARRQIQPGEQLTISYDYLGEGKKPRERSWFEIPRWKRSTWISNQLIR